MSNTASRLTMIANPDLEGLSVKQVLPTFKEAGEHAGRIIVADVL